MATTIVGFENNKRISTQKLLQKIYASLDAGETDFEVVSSGHHDIGGPLWTEDGSPLRFRVKNPGQRVGSFGLDGTEIIVEGQLRPTPVGSMPGRPWSSKATVGTLRPTVPQPVKSL